MLLLFSGPSLGFLCARGVFRLMLFGQLTFDDAMRFVSAPRQQRYRVATNHSGPDTSLYTFFALAVSFVSFRLFVFCDFFVCYWRDRFLVFLAEWCVAYSVLYRCVIYIYVCFVSCFVWASLFRRCGAFPPVDVVVDAQSAAGSVLAVETRAPTVQERQQAQQQQQQNSWSSSSSVVQQQQQQQQSNKRSEFNWPAGKPSRRMPESLDSLLHFTNGKRAALDVHVLAFILQHFFSARLIEPDLMGELLRRVSLRGSNVTKHRGFTYRIRGHPSESQVLPAGACFRAAIRKAGDDALCHRTPFFSNECC